MTSLNPVFTVGEQIAEAIRLHQGAEPARGARAGDGDAGVVEIPDPRAPRRRISASTLRRHAPARHDRDGAGLQSGTADRRRADDGARRHHPGADPGSAARSARRRSEWPSCSSRTTSASSPRLCERVVVMYGGRGRRGGAGERAVRATRSIPTPRACCVASRGSIWPRPSGGGSSRSRAPFRHRGSIKPGCRFAPRCAVRAAAAFRNNAAVARGAAGAQGRVLPAMNAIAQSLLRIRNLKKYFPVRSGLFSREIRPRPCGRRCELRYRGGRNAWPRWRVGLRQIDHGPRDPASDRADFG